MLVFSCHPDEQSDARRRRSRSYCTWAVAGDSPTGPWDVSSARPFEPEPALFAAPLVKQRDGGWALLGFRNVRSRGPLSLEIGDPIRVRLRDGALVAAYEPPRA